MELISTSDFRVGTTFITALKARAASISFQNRNIHRTTLQVRLFKKAAKEEKKKSRRPVFPTASEKIHATINKKGI
jgi:hypothetical protein